jgi:hypothetical protein
MLGSLLSLPEIERVSEEAEVTSLAWEGIFTCVSYDQLQPGSFLYKREDSGNKVGLNIISLGHMYIIF